MGNIIGYIRVSTKGQLEGNSIEDQRNNILDRYSNAKIIEENYRRNVDEYKWRNY